MSKQSAIRWRDWGPAAFQEAQAADRPILLRLSAVWCHWCHVMDGTSDKDPRAIQLLNERFVPIRVDIDRMPDVRERYNFGGFPTSAFLTPEGEILTGGTYIPPDQFVTLLESVATAYRDRKAEILAQLKEHAEHRKSHAPPSPAAGAWASVAQEILDAASQSVRLNFDGEHGGFGSQPKFPHSAAIELSLRLLGGPEGSAFETVARRTLDSMRRSALWDREELAFFRYSVTRDWSEPHYEKMLETNAGLLRNYALAAGLLGSDLYAATLREMREYLQRVLQDPATARFHGSQDADEAYYSLPLSARSARKAPFVDATTYTDWNAEMIEAHFEAYRATGDPSWLESGRRALDSLVRAVWDARAGLHHFAATDRRGQVGLLSDHAWLIRAILSAYELTGERERLALAGDLLRSAEPLWDAGRGLFQDKRPGPDDLGLVKGKSHPIPENGIMARDLLRYAHHAGTPPAAARAEQVLRALAPLAARQGLFASEAALAALESLTTPLEINVVASGADVGTLLAEAARVRHPRPVLRILDPRLGADEARKAGITSIKPPALFACSGTACSRLYRPGERFAADLQRMGGG